MSLKHMLGGTLLALATLVVPAQPSHAETKAWVDGIGGAKCSVINTDIKSNTAVIANSLAHWAYGYMTRRNFEQARDNRPQVDLTKNFDGDKLLSIIRGTCEKHPDAIVFQIVDELYEILLKEQTVTT